MGYFAPVLTTPMWQAFALPVLVLLACAGCVAASGPSSADAALYAKACEKQGHQPHTEAWRACIQSADLNAAIATQRAYDQKLLRRLDCIDPRIACPPAP